MLRLRACTAWAILRFQGLDEPALAGASTTVFTGGKRDGAAAWGGDGWAEGGAVGGAIAASPSSESEYTGELGRATAGVRSRAVSDGRSGMLGVSALSESEYTGELGRAPAGVRSRAVR